MRLKENLAYCNVRNSLKCQNRGKEDIVVVSTSETYQNSTCDANIP